MDAGEFLDARIFYLCISLTRNRANSYTDFCAALFAVQKLARFCGSRVDEKRICARFRPFKSLCGPV